VPIFPLLAAAKVIVPLAIAVIVVNKTSIQWTAGAKVTIGKPKSPPLIEHDR